MEQGVKKSAKNVSRIILSNWMVKIEPKFFFLFLGE
jgi:hypothetical protein